MNYFAKPDHLAYTWKGRVALYAILKGLGVGPGDEVIVPAYTCVVVPSAILHLGAQPVFADIEPDTYTSSARTIEPCITTRTRVIIAQNTYGLSADLDPIMQLADAHHAYVVEDGAHGLGSTYKNKPCGSVTHASFFSLQWSKPISTGLGGIAYTNDPVLARGIKTIVAAMDRCSPSQSLSLALQRMLRPIADHPWLHYQLVDAYRYLTQRTGLIDGSSAKDELDHPQIPPGYCRQMGRAQRFILRRRLTTLPQMIQRRQAVAQQLDEIVAGHDLQPPIRPAYAGHGMLRYALRVANQQEVIQAARQQRIPIGDWFRSPLHPVQKGLQQWKYETGRCPAAEQACREVINFYTSSISERGLERIARLLNMARPVESKSRQAA